MKKATTIDKDRLLHELEVHREELAIQNEALRAAQEALDASRDRFAELFELAPAGYVDLDARMRILEINLTGAGLLGVARPQLAGLPFTAFVALDELQGFLAHFRRCLRDGGRSAARITLSVRDGGHKRPMPAQLTSVAIKRKAGTVVRTAFVEVPHRDEDAEEAEREKQAARLAEFAPVVLSRVDLPEIATAAAHLAARSLGATFVEVLELQPEEHRLRTVAAAGRKRHAAQAVAATDAPYAEVLRTRQPIVLRSAPSELVARAPHLVAAGLSTGLAVVVPADPAQPYGVLAAYSAVRRAYEPGEIRFLKAVADMLGVAASHRRMEQALRESEGRFRSLVANSLVGFFIVQDGKVVFINPEQENIFGKIPVPFDVEELGRLVHNDDRAAFLRLFRGDGRARETRKGLRLRFTRYGCAPGAAAIAWTDCRAAPVQYRNRDAVLINAVDVTRVREMEQITAAGDKLASLGQLTAGMAHEIRNPLSGINLHLASLDRLVAEAAALDDPQRAAARHIADSLRKNSERIEAVIRRVMAFSRPRAPRFVAADINGCVEAAIELSMMGLRRLGVHLRTDLATGLPPVHADPQLIGQVLLNLLTNAGQAVARMDGPKTIEVSSAEEGERLVVRVGDSGPGVPDAIRDKIFSAFFTTKREGTGIGLAFCHRVVAEHGGTLAVGTSPLGGAEFRVELPVARDRAGSRIRTAG